VDTYRCAHIGQHPYLLSLRPDGSHRSLTLYLRLRDIGKNYVAFNLLAVVSKDYLRNRKQYGWPAWPAYLMWALLLCGLVVFVIGVFRL